MRTKHGAFLIGFVIFGVSTLSPELAFAIAPRTVPSGPASPAVFERACEPATSSIVVSAVGDILPQIDLARQAYSTPFASDGRPLGFESLWSRVTPYIKAADLSYGNLEGPAAAGILPSGAETADPGPVYDGNVYTGTAFVFNYHPRIVADLKRTGFDFISGANNHSMDRGSRGIDRSVDVFEREGLPYGGVRRAGGVRQVSVVTTARDFKVAWIACTEMTQGVPDSRGQVQLCLERRSNPNRRVIHSEIVNEIRRLRQDQTIDAIIVTPHWGLEYVHIADEGYQRFGREFVDAGADAVIGSHPHVLQQLEVYKSGDRQSLIAYSLGNFVSGQGKWIGQKLTALLFLGFSKRSGERAWINGVSYLPLWMERGPHSVSPLATSGHHLRNQAYTLLHTLFDPTREIRPTDRIRTNLECGN